jgi:hypothetical protein
MMPLEALVIRVNNRDLSEELLAAAEVPPVCECDPLVREILRTVPVLRELLTRPGASPEGEAPES